jgi:hypothetical protein
VAGRLQHPQAQAGGGGQLSLPGCLEPTDPGFQGAAALLEGARDRRVDGDLAVGRLPESGPLGAGLGQRPEGRLGLVADGGHLALGAGEHFREAVEREGDLPEGGAGGVQVGWDPGQLGPEQVALGADPGARVQATQAGGGLGGGGGEPAVAAARLANCLGVALDHEDLRRERVGRHHARSRLSAPHAASSSCTEVQSQEVQTFWSYQLVPVRSAGC